MLTMQIEIAKFDTEFNNFRLRAIISRLRVLCVFSCAVHTISTVACLVILQTRPAGSHNKHCLFKEHYNLEHNMFEYYSLADPTWRLGFGKYGKALAANRWLKVPSQARCFRFMKSPVEHKHRHQHHKDVANARVDSGAVNLNHPPHVPQSHVEVRPEDVTVHRHTGAAGSRTKTSPRENENNVVTTHRT